MSWIVRQIWNYEIGGKTNEEVHQLFISNRAELAIDKLVARDTLLSEITDECVYQQVDRANNQLHTCRQFAAKADAERWLDFVTKTYDSFGGFTRVSSAIEEGDGWGNPRISDL